MRSHLVYTPWLLMINQYDITPSPFLRLASGPAEDSSLSRKESYLQSGMWHCDIHVPSLYLMLHVISFCVAFETPWRILYRGPTSHPFCTFTASEKVTSVVRKRSGRFSSFMRKSGSTVSAALLGVPSHLSMGMCGYLRLIVPVCLLRRLYFQ